MRKFLISIIVLINSCVQCNPQLDLPPVPITPPSPPRDVKPTLQFNSYSDRDRSVRFGPPYDDETDVYDKGHDTSNRSRTGSGRESYAGSYYNDERVRDDQYYRDRTRDECRPNCNRYDGNYRNSERYNDDNNYRGRDPGSYQERDRPRDYENRDQNNRDQYNRDQYNRDQYNRDRPSYNDDRNPQYYNGGNNGYYNRTRNPGDDYNDRTRYGNDSPYSYNERDRYNRPSYGNDDPLNDPRYRQEMENLKKVLAEIDKKSSLECNLNVAAQWEFETNVNEATHAQAVSLSLF